MSLEDYHTVDLVVRLPGDPPRAALVVYDGSDNAEPTVREAALRKKLAAYLLFVVSGQFHEQYAQLARCEPCIKVVCANPPSANMMLIEALHDPAHPDVALTVEMTTNEDFRAAFRQL